MFNTKFEVHEIRPRGLPETPRELIPRSFGAYVTFESRAPAWLINAFRAVFLDYCRIKHLAMIPGSFKCNDPAVQHDYFLNQLKCIVCEENAPVGARFSLNVNHTDPDACLTLQARMFAPEDGASAETFEGAIYLYWIHPQTKIAAQAQVIEEEGYKSAVKPIVTSMRFATATEERLALGLYEVDTIYERRHELEILSTATDVSEPYLVRLKLHSGWRYQTIWADAHAVIARYLDQIKESLPGALTLGDVNVMGRGYKGYVLAVNEPRGHILGLLKMYLLEECGKTPYLSFVDAFDAITSKSSAKVVFDGTFEELVADLRRRCDALKELARRFNDGGGAGR